MALNVEFIAGPGVGKSTTCSLAFGELKFRGHNIELDHEFAKQLTWEGRSVALGFQPYVFGKQAFARHRLEENVDAILSDTSLLLSLLYKPQPAPEWYKAFEEFIIDYYLSLDTMVIYLDRDPKRDYNPKGRNQTEEQAKEIDRKTLDMLTTHGIPFVRIPVDSGFATHVMTIVDLIEDRL